MPTPRMVPADLPTMNTLDEVMESIPTLSLEGFFDSRDRKPHHSTLAQSRQYLLEHHDRILRTVTWCQNELTPIQTCEADSYSLKHLLERQRDGWYITNGEMIAAGILAGLPWQQGWYDGPNIMFGVSRLDIRRLYKSSTR